MLKKNFEKRTHIRTLVYSTHSQEHTPLNSLPPSPFIRLFFALVPETSFPHPSLVYSYPGTLPSQFLRPLSFRLIFALVPGGIKNGSQKENLAFVDFVLDLMEDESIASVFGHWRSNCLLRGSNP